MSPKLEETTESNISLVTHDKNNGEEPFADKFFASVNGALNMQTAYIGYKLGWYTALKEADGLTAADLAAKTNTSARYAKEWLEMQAVAGWIGCLDPSEDAENRRYWLPADRVEVLADPDSLSYFLPITGMLAGPAKKMDMLVEAYRNDTGVSWETFGDDARESQASLNRPFFLHGLPSLLEGVLDQTTVAKLHHSGGRIADIGAGYGWSSIGLAKYFRASQVETYDLDYPSVERAKAIVAAQGLEDRITTHYDDAANADPDHVFDLVLALECIHDMPDPIGVLKSMRGLAGANGTVIVMDELTHETFSTEPNPMEQFLYGMSCVCCLPDSKSSGGKSSAATGTVMRPSVFRMYAQQAGFKEVEILPVDHDMFRFYKLVV